MAQIKCDNLTLGYDNNVILKNVSLEVNSGDYLVIIGKNGAGKTTLMKTILGLMKPIKGTIKLDEGLKRTEIGYLPQQTEFQKDFPASVQEVVLSGCLSRMGIRPFYTKAEKELAKNNITEMGLDGLEKKSYRELSGGQQQRVLLARALCATRKILLLDEPVAGLDPDMTQQMYELIEKLNSEGTTIIMISHDLSVINKYATHVLNVAKDIFYGTKKEFLNSDLEEYFLKHEGGENNE